MARAHAIESCSFELTFATAALARREEPRLEQWLREQLLPALDELFDEYAPGEKVLRFERLEFDFGSLPSSSYQQEITRQLLHKMTELLRERRLEIPAQYSDQPLGIGDDNAPGATEVKHARQYAAADKTEHTENHQEEQAVSRARALPQLIIFLRTGQLPWHSADEDNPYNAPIATTGAAAARRVADGKHQQLLAGLLESPELPTALRAIPEREQLLARLFNQFPETQLSALLEKLAPGTQDEFAFIWQLLRAALANQLVRSSVMDARAHYWKSLLHTALENHSAGNSRWPEQFLMNLARAMQLPQHYLREQLDRAAGLLPAAKSEFVRYLRGNQLQAHPGLKEKDVQWAAPFWSPSTKDQGDLRYQLANAFLGGNSEQIAALWSELANKQADLLLAAARHYLAQVELRQKIVLQFPLALLASIGELLCPPFALARLYQQLAPSLAVLIATSVEAVERELWEISFNLLFTSASPTRLSFLVQVCRQFSHRQAIALSTLADALVAVDEGALAENLKASVSGGLQTKSQPIPDTNLPIVAKGLLQQLLAGENIAQELRLLARNFLARLLDDTSVEPAVSSVNLAMVLRELLARDRDLLQALFVLVLSELRAELPASLSVNDWQLLHKYYLLSHPALNSSQARRLMDAMAGPAQPASVINTGEAHVNESIAQEKRTELDAALRALDKRSLDFLSFLERKIQSSVSASLLSKSATDATTKLAKNASAEAAAKVIARRTSRWRALQTQLQSGDMTLADMTLDNKTGPRTIKSYLAASDQIAEPYRQVLLASLLAAADSAPDTADYYRRIVYCLMHQQPLDLDEILASKDFWRERNAAVVLSRASKNNIAKEQSQTQLPEQLSPESLSPEQPSPAQPSPELLSAKQLPSEQLPQELLSEGLSLQELSSQEFWDEPLSPVQGLNDELPAQAYDQALWGLLNRIHSVSVSGPAISLSLAQLQRALEFYLARTTQIADDYRTNLAASIAQQSNNITELQLRAHFYAHVLQRLLAGKEIDFNDQALLKQPGWLQAENVQQVEKILARTSDNDPESITASTQAVTPSVIEELSEQDDEQALWAQFDRLQSLFISGGSIALSHNQLQQLLEFYLVRSPNLDDEFRTSLAASIAQQANKISEPPLRVNFYANILQSLLAGTEIDLSAQVLLKQPEWLQSDNVQQAEQILARKSADEPESIAASAQAVVPNANNTLSKQDYDQALWAQLDQLKSLFISNGKIALPLNQLQQLLEFYLARSPNIADEFRVLTGSAIAQQATRIADPELRCNYYAHLLQRLLSNEKTVDGKAINSNIEVTDPQLLTAPAWLQIQDLALEQTKDQVSVTPEPTQSAELLATTKSRHASQQLEISAETVLSKIQLQALCQELQAGAVSLSSLPLTSEQWQQLVDAYIALNPTPESSFLQRKLSRQSKTAEDKSAFLRKLLQRLLQVHAGMQLSAQAPIMPSPSTNQQPVINAESSIPVELPVNLLPSSNLSPVSAQHSLPTIAALANPDEATKSELAQLGKAIAQRRVAVTDLVAGQEQLALLVEFFIVTSESIATEYRAQLQESVTVFSARARDKRHFYCQLLQALLSDELLDMENFAEIEPENLQDKTVEDNSALQKLEAEKSVLSPTQSTDPLLLPATNAPAAPTIVEESLLELLQLPSLTDAQAGRLLQLVKTQMARRQPEDIKLWFNALLRDTVRRQLIRRLPDYALHELARLAQPAAYNRVYPVIKQVLDALASLAPSANTARVKLHETKWLFVLRQLLDKAGAQIDKQVLLVFAREVAQAAGLGDTNRLTRLVEQRLVLTDTNRTLDPANPGKDIASEKDNSSDQLADGLLTEALHEGIAINNAGQVLVAPFIGRLFSMLQLTEQGEFVSLAAKDRAAHLLEYVVTGKCETPEYDLLLNKVMVGMSTGIPLSAGITITEQEETIVEQLLNSVIQHWKVIGSTSIRGLRETFLCRPGWLYLDEDGWRLRVQPGPFDMLIDQLPWSISLIKHGWMEQPLRVSWRE